MKPQITDYTDGQIGVMGSWGIGGMGILTSTHFLSVPLCNFVANFLVIFLGTAMIPRLHAETNENQHHRAAQHRGSTRCVVIARFL